MSETAQIISIGEYRQTNVKHEDRLLISGEDYVKISSSSDAKPSQRETSVEDLYPSDVTSDPLVQRVRLLLVRAADFAGLMRESLASGNNLDADQQTMLLQGILPELFCCRDVSEGMATFVLGLYHGLKNQNGKPLTLDQGYVIAKALRFISERPFLSFFEALDFLAQLESEGVEINPQEAAALNELLLERDETLSERNA